MTTFALIPGAGGEAWYWHRVAPLLRQAGFGVVTPDLPAADDDATFDDYADAVVRAVEEHRSLGSAAGHPLDDDLVVVCQSLGGFTGVLVCERVDVRLLIFVAAMIPAPGETAGAWWAATDQGEATAEYAASEGRPIDAEFDAREIFFHDVPAEVTAEAFARAEPVQSENIFASAWKAAAWPAVDVRVIAGRYDRLFPLPFMQRQSRDRLGIEPVVVDGGHLSALSIPDELARVLVACARPST
ncbi:alpha/beta hydrolase [Subtercola endophyticus]|uniref:alpha/beta hydrolase n=1 Tax=Subtercola endophyticus TaxID=2895559 RepID=UPI001E384B1E|nr:alpha/beta hydrolase [Subtercola endophyticus]UFS58516.1 alpha/beta hydrolase [Subtercola endophyticus]